MSRFHSAVTQLSRMSGRDFETTIKSELAAVLTNAQRGTVKASVAKIRSHVRNQQFARLDLGQGRKLYFLGNRMPEEQWRKVVEYQNRKEARRKAARGLASRMWLHVAEQIGVQLKSVPAYVRNAVSGPRKDDMGNAVTVHQSGTGSRYEVGFINSLTDSNIGAKAGRAFRSALTARANFFSQSVKLAAKGVIANVLARYPGLGRVS
jgi:hypothetical protein